MTSVSDILKRVRRIEIKARRFASETFSGGYQSSFRGQGLDFDDLREYMEGDETRFIDWKVTARMGTPFIRQFKEERELSLLIAVDISPSMFYGSQRASKLEYAAEMAALLAFSAQHTGDKCGLLLFDSKPRLYLPPAKGYKQVLRLVREILEAGSNPKSQQEQNVASNADSLAEVSSHLLSSLRKKSLVFLLSDFLFPENKSALGKLSFKHEIVALRLHDPAEIHLPDGGNVILKDAETEELIQINLSHADVRQNASELMLYHRHGWQTLFNQLGLDNLSLSTEDNYVSSLQQLFKRRTHRIVR